MSIPQAIHKVIVLGSGPAGLTSALYAARAQLAPLVLHGNNPGGQLTTTSTVENFPGFGKAGVEGPELISQMQEQAEHAGAAFQYGHVVKVTAPPQPAPITLDLDDGTSLQTHALIVATGAKSRLLEIPTEQTFWGKGVSTCATCDGFFYKNKVVGVVGGGDSAAEEALYLTRMCSKVYLIHRRDALRASRVMSQRVAENPKIEKVWDSVVDHLSGTPDGLLSHIHVKNVKTNESKALPASGLFVAIGHIPNTEPFGLLDRDANGYIKLANQNSTKSNVEGIFVAGDCSDHVFRQAITAAGTGCMAAIEAERWLEAKGV
ncbi:thioredoxin reductase [Capsaspora owczarzaki ATCC 30864]|uniref:Thioredoxin reductase n=1 Tax=Capsaspora owczarzaki (strain ATCC 30864) TaxID=595528 RepID=A0A0D2W0J2_CAPO3|nr:thioredoxin reductase [Capsaspora owczarzaki ATCC 30864]KJE97727.1 thioredoxin reductase [Capsaspora owczarzaki ATCC 30864]|eukprot:XP_004342905.1 thioredoxin reductase [Capsaspora owczarzaki ATCC 30864]